MKLLFLVALLTSLRHSNEISLQVSVNDVNLEVNEKTNFTIFLSDPKIDVDFDIITDHYEIVSIQPDNGTLNENVTVVKATVHAQNPGHVTITFNTTQNISTSDAFVRVSVLRHNYLDVIAQVIGWVYFVAWSISFYPQTYTNFKRKSVVGLNFDYVGLNITGFSCYSLFNVGLYFFKTVQNEYLIEHPFGIIPVELQDVVFGLHAAFATILQLVQCCIYERGNQKVSRPAIAMMSLIWSGGFIFFIVTLCGGNSYSPWLTFLYYFSYSKLAITLVKYIPQAYYNYRRKSTEGWSIGNILLDFTGGSLSMLQMFIIAFNFDDWKSLFGNFTKFGLGLISILFDVLFMTQHYCVYRPKNRLNTLIQSDEPDASYGAFKEPSE